ncbi:MAG: ribonuclease J [Hyphomicrobiaceae bacterium]
MTEDARTTARDSRTELVMVALGGLGEIGMNVYLYGLGAPADRQWLMVDCGLTFPGEAEPGVDVVLPDLAFIEAEKKRLAGILITHAHEDHIGAVLDLWPRLEVPVYATPFTAGMLKAKMAEFGGRKKPSVREVALSSRFRIGPFDIELVSMSHSIPETSGVVLRTPVGTAFHTADWKLDRDPYIGQPTDEAKIQALGQEGIDALICDSTNAFRDGRSPSETEVARSLAEIVKKAPGRVALTTFSSNVARIKAVADAAEASGRTLVVAGRALHRVIQVAIETGYLPESFRWLDQDRFKHLSPNKVLALITGSQGEPRAALARISLGEHPDISLGAGDLVIYSSRTIPGNEKAVLATQNRLAEMGCSVMTDADGLVHVTGHPRRDELRELYGWVRPKVLVPMHGEARHLREHARLAKSAGIGDVIPVRNGDIVRLAPGHSKIIDEAPTGRLYRDGRLIVASGDGPVRERRKLSMVGLVAVALALDDRGELAGEADCAIDGVPAATEDGASMEDVVLDAVEDTIAAIPARRRRDIERTRDAVQRAVRAAVFREWGKKPIVKVLVASVDGRV